MILHRFLAIDSYIHRSLVPGTLSINARWWIINSYKEKTCEANDIFVSAVSCSERLPTYEHITGFVPYCLCIYWRRSNISVVCSHRHETRGDRAATYLFEWVIQISSRARVFQDFIVFSTHAHVSDWRIDHTEQADLKWHGTIGVTLKLQTAGVSSLMTRDDLSQFRGPGYRTYWHAIFRGKLK